jgi:pyruvate, orthophosphate dikinase
MHIVRIGGASREQHSADAIGAKAANLARMAALGLPVPPAFVLPVKLCAVIIARDAHAERHLRAGLEEGIEFLEQAPEGVLATAGGHFCYRCGRARRD